MLQIAPSLQGKIRTAMAWVAVVSACLSSTWVEARSGANPSPGVQASCNWNRPGVDPFMGDVVGAVDRYTDIPVDVRARLKARMAKRDYDDLVSIRRDRIVGDHGQQFNPTIRDMHFGAGQVCHTVSRDAWTASMQERGLVYCESGHCILVPTVCRNVSRIAQRGVAPEHAEGPDDDLAVLPPVGAAPAVPGVGPALAGLPATPLGAEGSPVYGAAGPADAGPPRTFASAAGGGAGPAFPGATGGGSPGSPLVSTASPSAPLAPGEGLAPPVLIAAAVPEPATWASLVAGLVGVSWFARRRRLNGRASAADSAR